MTHCKSGKIQLSIFDIKHKLKPGTNPTIHVLVSTEVSLHQVYNIKLWDLVTPICITCVCVCVCVCARVYTHKYTHTHTHTHTYIQGVPGGMCQTSGGCSLC